MRTSRTYVPLAWSALQIGSMAQEGWKGRGSIKKLTYPPPRLTIVPKQVGEIGGEPIPSRADIAAHCERYKYEDVDIDEFFNYYERVGWSNLRSWKNTIRLWNYERKHAPIGKVVSMAAFLKRSTPSSKPPNGIGHDQN